MGKIVILDENTANKIAAGEVIERPASVIKELVENSIDAGADTISVEVRNGGISFLKVTDNGAGMDEDDVEIAFERHSTSKIRSSLDLEDIRTLGFRGEALASIAAVSSVELITRVKKNPHGMVIKIKGGNILEVKQTGCPVGTTFIIKELFYNTPARFKFLKKDSTEAGYISDILNRIALSNPQISIKLNSSGIQLLHTPGNNDVLSTIFSVYGKETAKNALPINYDDGKLKIIGYAGKPEIARSNRNHQSFFINGRYIKSRLISSAVEEAYKTLLMKGKHAFIVLNIGLNPMLVDVNVHPTKAEVRFSQEQEVFKSVYHAVCSALLNNTLIRNVSFEKPGYDYKLEKKPIIEYKQETLNTDHIPATNIMKHSVNSLPLNDFSDESICIKEENSIHDLYDGKKEETLIENLDPRSMEEALVKKVDSSIKEEALVENLDSGSKEEALVEKVDSGIKEEALDENLNISSNELDSLAAGCTDNIRETNIKESYEINEGKTSITETVSPVISSELKDARYIGQAFSTFIIMQHGSELMLIDQHAAHERIMYEKLMKKFKNNEPLAQYLLAPLVIELTHQEMRIAEESTNFFNKLGFIFENFGNNSLILRAVPIITDNNQIKETFMNTLDRFISTDNGDYFQKADDVLYTMACKAAVKANKKLDELEVQYILDELLKLDNPYSCPHGRPTIIKITRYELEKRFKRIV